MSRALLVTLLVAFISLSLSASPPEWNNPFTVAFNETTTLPVIGTHSTTGVMFFIPGKFTKITRVNGRFDRYCGSMHPLTNMPCTHWVSEGVRYLEFPEKKECCRCCDASQGCSVLRNDWLKNANATDGGVYHMDDGTAVHRWTVKGLQDNIYDGLEERQEVPVQILQQPNDFMYFDVKSYKAEVDESEAQLPDRCRGAKKCPLLSLCSVV